MGQLHIVLSLCLILGGGIGEACWGSSKKPAAKTVAPSQEVEEQIQAANVPKSDAARKVSPSSSRSSNSPAQVETAELKRLSEELYALDVNGVGSQLTVNLQGKTNSESTYDAAPAPLFTNVPPKALEGETYSTFVALLDNYIADVRSEEVDTRAEQTEKNRFLDAVSRTNIMKKTHRFLKDKGFITTSLREHLDKIWFTPYTRSKNTLGSSGFEHVFLGEIKHGDVSGFHNWVYFWNQENEGTPRNMNYKGYYKTIDLGNKNQILKMRFDWLRKPKNFGSMFIGTSPELEMALYTICFHTRPRAGCNLQINKQKVRIKVYPQNYRGQNLIGSAFPEIY